MATKNDKTNKKPANTANPSRIRQQLVFDDETTERAEKLAKAEMRSFNNLMAWLINREWERKSSKP